MRSLRLIRRKLISRRELLILLLVLQGILRIETGRAAVPGLLLVQLTCRRAYL